MTLYFKLLLTKTRSSLTQVTYHGIVVLILQNITTK